MKSLHGFELLEERELPEYRSTASLYRHVRTGAELLSIVNDDENKVFGVTFRTPPRDSTGVAHILEHSVLCGSDRYPVKEPFVELLKGSLHTFLNAFTFPDKTCYPVASVNRRDFHNLMDVYLDAVFHPRLTPRTLAQEGWHYELPAPDSPLTIQGVVYNEMKGVYSSPDSLLGEVSQQTLFPDTLYGLDSGGSPEHIPSLTFDPFLAFHRRYYHPSNARFFFSGDDAPEERLRRIAAELEGYERMDSDSEIPLQPKIPEPRRIERSFPTDPSSPDAANGFVTLNWLLPAPFQAATVLDFGLISHLLVGTPASPLRKALIESGLGEDLANAGLDTQLRQMLFSVGLRGIRPEDADAFEALTFEALARVARGGFAPDLIEAALNTSEFALRENNTGRFPRGLAMMLRALTPWLHGESPFEMLAYEKPLTECKRLLAADPMRLARLVETHWIGNLHRTRLVLRPDPALAAERETAEKIWLEQAKKALTASDLARISEEARLLREAQEAPDAPEALATIPSLTLADLDRVNRILPCEEQSDRTYWHDLFTGGLLYLNVGFSLRALPARLLPYVALFGRILFEAGAGEEDYVAFTCRIGRLTGGLSAGEEVVTRLSDRRASPWLLVSGKSTVERAPDLCGLLRDALLASRLHEFERIRQMILEEKADLEAGLIPSGNSVVSGRLEASFTEAGWILEQTGGIEYLAFIRDLARRATEDWPGVQADLEEIRERIIRRPGHLVNVTAAASDWPAIRTAITPFRDALPSTPRADEFWTRPELAGPEALVAPSTVHFVGMALPFCATVGDFHGSALVISRYLRTSWLWDRIRVQGGAYGAGCRVARATGLLHFSTYRDPNLERSLDAFEASAAVLEECRMDDLALSRAIIGAIGEIDAHLLPDAKGRVSMIQQLTGDTPEARQRLRDEILSTTPSHFRAFGERLRAALPDARISVLGPDSVVARLETRTGHRVNRIRVL